MKIKEINRTANLAWSPKQQYPIYIAAGTAAQQLDATFSTSAALELFHMDLSSGDFDMPLAGKLESNRRFNKLEWTDFGISSESHPNGLIIAGADNGEICVYNPAAILSGNNTNALVHTLAEHTGSVQALDMNKFQNHLFASGAGNSEILIWDLKNPGKGLVPGQKTNPPDQINCVKWNQQVGHILAASSQSARVVVWDLRKSEPIIKVGDQSAMFHYKTIGWHPDVATQMLIGNEDDRYPVIQMWDLRFATSPVKVFEGHARGVMSLAWCPQDSDLLMSCGKDNRLLCWNPNTQAPSGEIIYELPTSGQWTSEIRWCPRFPGIISTSSFDGQVTVSSVMGGAQQFNQQQQSQISDSFGIQQDAFNLPQQQQPQTVIIEPLKKPPKWMRKPCGAKFSFGGKLLSFGLDKDPGTPKQVFVSQVVTEPEFLQRSQELENSLITGQLTEFCDMKITQEKNEKEKLLWQFLKSNFHNEPRIQFLNLLGYNPQDLAQKISKATTKEPVESVGGVNPTELASKMEKLKTDSGVLSPDSAVLGSGSDTPFDGVKTPGSDNEGNAMFEAIAAQTAKEGVIEELEEIKKSAEPFAISVDEGTDGLICQALLTGNFEAAVDVCFNENRMADGLLLAIAGGPDLFSRTQKRYLEQAKSAVAKVISAVVNRDWRSIVENAEITNWKEALCTLVTYSKAEEFSDLCCRLGERLEQEAADFNSALICYICAGHTDKMVACWTRGRIDTEHKPEELQDLVEKVMILKRSVENGRYQVTAEGSFMADQLCKYASLLSSQGSLQTAMVYLSAVDDQKVAVLKDRIFRAHGNLHGQPPEFPFQRVNVQTQPTSKYQQQKSNKSPMPSFERYSNTHAPGQPIPPRFSPVNKNPPNNFYNPNSNLHTSSYRTEHGDNQSSNMYTQPPSGQPNIYQPQPPPTGPMTNGLNYTSPPPVPFNTNPSAPNMTPTPPNLSVPQPGIFNPMQNQPPQPMGPPLSMALPHSVAPPHSMAPPPPNVFNPATNISNTQNIYQPPPPQANVMQPNIMQPNMKTADVAPPRSDRSHPMSMKAAKQESPVQPVTPQEPMNFYNPVAPQPHMGNMQPNMTTTPNIMSLGNAVPPGQTQLPKQSPKQEIAPAPTKMKGPIPAEHMVLQQTYDALVERCKNATQSPQTKRKLEDVRRKLEILYDLLRENKVSPNVLNNLHQIVQVCQSADYMAGLQIHTHMITTGNFSEISSFMPGLKTLMQIANQLRL